MTLYYRCSQCGFLWHGADRETRPCPMCRQAELEAEVKRLRAIVDELPKTADGVPVIPGISEVWVIDGCLGPKRTCNWNGKTHVLLGGDIGYHIKPESFSLARECYSTREAAEAKGDE